MRETINISLHFSAARQNNSRLTEVRVSQHAASQILQYHNWQTVGDWGHLGGDVESSTLVLVHKKLFLKRKKQNKKTPLKLPT